jgi:hypothetical protein
LIITVIGYAMMTSFSRTRGKIGTITMIVGVELMFYVIAIKKHYREY